MKKPEITLSKVRKSPKLGGKVFQASDFLTDDEQLALQLNNATGRKKKRIYDEVDAYVAEIIARFGYDAYKAWNAGELDENKMVKMIAAERARDKAQLLEVEGIIIAMVGACVQKQKGKPAPKGPKVAINIFKRVSKMARGEING